MLKHKIVSQKGDRARTARNGNANAHRTVGHGTMRQTGDAVSNKQNAKKR